MTDLGESDTESFGHQEQTRGQEGEHRLCSEKTVQGSTRSDGSGHSVPETVGQTQSGGDGGDEVGCHDCIMMIGQKLLQSDLNKRN